MFSVQSEFVARYVFFFFSSCYSGGNTFEKMAIETLTVITKLCPALEIVWLGESLAGRRERGEKVAIDGRDSLGRFHQRPAL